MTASDPVLLPRPRIARWSRDPSATCVARGVPSTEIDPALGPQAYRIRLDQDSIHFTAGGAPGLFYAQKTLEQLRRECGEGLPQGEIIDWPDFPVRGVMLDISRDKVPTMATLFSLIDLFAELKINQLQLYTEHAFAYSRHKAVWEHASPMTAEEIRQLDRYCQDRFIELVPNQNSFGHMARWLKHPQYEPLAEKLDGFTFPWGAKHEGGFTLNPLDPRSLELIEGLYDELLPNFTSKQINVGCDETFDLGLGKSAAECERRGKERVYLDFLLKIRDAVVRRGCVMQFWGDIVLHKPELIPELPKDVIALNWGYDADHPFEKESKAFADAGVPFYVCPGTSSWLSISGRTDNTNANLKSAAMHGLANRACGYLITDWGDLGHLQYLPVSYLGIAAGAAFSWCLQSNENLDLAAALDAHIFRDRASVMGKLVHDFGNVYQAVKTSMGMSTRLFWALVGGKDRRKLWEVITKEEFDDAEARLDEIVSRLDRAEMDCHDAELVKAELRNGAAMLRFGCQHGRWRLGVKTLPTSALRDKLESIVQDHRDLWLARNRPGGLVDSCRQLETRLAEYK